MQKFKENLADKQTDAHRHVHIHTYAHLVELQLPLYNGRSGSVQSFSVATLAANILHHLDPETENLKFQTTFSSPLSQIPRILSV